MIRERLLDELLSPQFRRFLLAGGSAACINLVSRALFERFVPYSLAVLLAYLTGMLTAYVLARRFVFPDSQRTHAEASARFVIVNIFGIAQTWVASIALGEHALPALGFVTHAHAIGHLIGVGVPVFTSFVAHRFWTFR